jgi:hypothetical protein
MGRQQEFNDSVNMHYVSPEYLQQRADNRSMGDLHYAEGNTGNASQAYRAPTDTGIGNRSATFQYDVSNIQDN